MGSVSPAQAVLLSHCDVGSSRFDELTTDQFLGLLPIDLVEGNCISYPRILDSDKPSGIDYTSSGGAMNVDAVGYSDEVDVSLARIVSRATVAGDILTNVSQVHDVLEDQALAMAQLVIEKVSENLWSDTPSPDAPAGMPSFAALNPAGTLAPVQGAGKPLKFPDDLLCLREHQAPWNPGSRQYYVMNSKTYFGLLRQAWSTGTSLLEFKRDEHSGQTLPHVADVPIVASDHISLNEEGAGTTSVYLTRVGSSEHDPQKISGVRMGTSSKYPNVTIGSARGDDDQPDEYFAEVEWNVVFSPGSASSTVRLSQVAAP